MSQTKLDNDQLLLNQLDVIGYVRSYKQGTVADLAYKVDNTYGPLSWAQPNLIGHFYNGSQDGTSIRVPSSGNSQSSGIQILADGTHLFYRNATEALRLDSAGNAGLGGAPKGGAGGFRFLENSTASWMVQDNSGACYYGKNWYYTGSYKYKTTGNTGLLYVQDGSGHSWHVAPVGNADAVISWTQAMTLDNSGNLLVGVSNGNQHTIQKNLGEGWDLLYVQGNNGAASTIFKAVGLSGYSTAQAAIFTGKHSTNGRSINVGGTINASGADYAEYMRKADSCGQLAKGAIVGIDVDGRLTDKWAAAVSFLIKSTDPSYVGGDVWGSSEALGMAKPIQPALQLPAYTGAPDPGQRPELPDPADLVDVADKALEQVDTSGLEAQQLAYDQALAAYQVDQLAHAQAIAAAMKEFNDVTYPAYQVELAKFEALLEQARQRVDRMAYCGQVPVNVKGAKPGQYVLAAPDGDGIKGVLVDKADLNFGMYRDAVGIVQNILPDGRANVRVKPV
jgi:hypothetical protein